jgi:hypothetical protein
MTTDFKKFCKVYFISLKKEHKIQLIKPNCSQSDGKSKNLPKGVEMEQIFTVSSELSTF